MSDRPLSTFILKEKVTESLAKLNLHPCTVGSIVRKWKGQDSTVRPRTVNRPRTGAPRTDSWKIIREQLVKSWCKIYKQQSNELCQQGLRSCSARKVPLLKKTHVEARLKFANDHLYKPTSFWNNILRSDET